MNNILNETQIKCISSFLRYRRFLPNMFFKEDLKTNYFEPGNQRKPVFNENDIDKIIKEELETIIDENTAVMLSGGIDSAIMASYLPKGSIAYTLKAMSPNAIDETEEARKYCDYYGLEQRVVEINWSDFEKYTIELIRNKNAPIHSIEVQLYVAALQAKKDGIKKLIFGESADVLFGGFDGLLSQDWSYKEFVERYSYINPENVLKDYEPSLDLFDKYRKNNKIDSIGFIENEFFRESVSSYTNALELAGVEFIAPFTKMYLATPLDLKRIRSGESKYLIRDLFTKKYPGMKINKKIPLPRPMGDWLANWSGPTHNIFKEDIIDDLKPDQKWLIYSLDLFLNEFDNS